MRASIQRKDKAIKHTPLGYEISDGRIKVNEDEANAVRSIIQNYLSGMSLIKAASEAGFQLTHSSVKRILTNKRYLGDGFYPRIIDDETAHDIEREMKRRATKLGRNNLSKKEKVQYLPDTSYRLTSIDKKFSDPVAQAEYVYSLIDSEVI